MGADTPMSSGASSDLNRGSYGRKRGWRRAALVLIGVALLAPLWLVRYPPLLDYPNHLASSFVLAHLADPAKQFNQFYTAEWGPYPYLAKDVFLLALMRVVPAETAGRLFLSLCVLALPLAGWFFLRNANAGEEAQSLWVLAVAYNLFFLYGFLNFALSLAVCLVTLGLWLRYLERPTATRWAIAAAAVLGLYFTHLVGFGIAGLVATFYCLAARRKLRTMLRTWAMFAPGVLLYLWLRWRIPGPTGGVIFRTWDDKLDSVFTVVHGYSGRLDWLTLAALAAYFLLAWWRNSEFRWNGRWGAVAVGFFAVYWVLPWGYGEGSDLDIRVLPMVFVLLLATVKIAARGWRLAPLVLLVFALRTVNVGQNFRAVQPELEGLARSFAATEPNARVFPIVESPDDDPIRHEFAHFWAYGVIERGWRAPYLFDAPGLTPLRMRESVYTADGFWSLRYDQPPDWATVQSEFDYVWAYNTERLAGELGKIGEPVYEAGRLRVFRMKKVSSKEE